MNAYRNAIEGWERKILELEQEKASILATLDIPKASSYTINFKYAYFFYWPMYSFFQTG